MANELQRLAQAVERMADQVREDLRDIDRAQDYLHDRFRDIAEQLERIETRLRRNSDRDSSGPIPIVVRDHPSAPIALVAPSDTLPVVGPPHEGPITANHERISIRWDVLIGIWKYGKLAILFVAGALVSWLQGYLSSP